MAPTAKSALSFAAIGLALYACAVAGAEWLVYRAGHANPLYKIATAPPEPAFDWVVLGASHAMPLDFGDVNERMQRDTGLRIVNLASPGTGPLYNRFVFEQFLRTHRTAGLLYVVDSFAFYSRAWNEDRFADAKLLRRTPWSPATLRALAGYVGREGVDARALLDYASGFSKVNNRERFERDAWEGELQFDRAYRSSSAAVDKRIAYLYPDRASPAALARYLDQLGAIVAGAQREGVRVVAIKMPTPALFRSRLPEEAAFDRAVASLLASRGVPLRDFSADIAEPRLYFDTDHLNREGIAAFVARDLEPLLAGRGG